MNVPGLTAAGRRALLDAYTAQGRDVRVQARDYRTMSDLYHAGMVDGLHRITIEGMRAEPLLRHELGELHAAALLEHTRRG